MGMFDKESKSVDETQAEAMMERLDGFAKTRVDQVDIPEEVRPTDLEAWILAPEAARVRFAGAGAGASSGGGMGAPAAAAGGAGLTPDVERLITDKFDRLEAALGMMEASIVMAASSGGGGTVVHQIGEDGEVMTMDSGDSAPADASGPGFSTESGAGAGLLDLYEAQAVKVNPFLKHEAVAEAAAAGGPVDAASLVAVLLDNLSGGEAVEFLNAASRANLLYEQEANQLLAIASLASPGQASANGATLPDRALLTFVAMVNSWRAANVAASQGA
jgi:hypothetical protein